MILLGRLDPTDIWIRRILVTFDIPERAFLISRMKNYIRSTCQSGRRKTLRWTLLDTANATSAERTKKTQSLCIGE
nr:MAG TPA: hypothetical protein [Caudoviricetes sp.]